MPINMLCQTLSTMWKAGHSLADYYLKQTKPTFLKVDQGERPIPNLEPRSILVINSGECNDYKFPTPNSKKREMAVMAEHQRETPLKRFAEVVFL